MGYPITQSYWPTSSNPITQSAGNTTATLLAIQRNNFVVSSSTVPANPSLEDFGTADRPWRNLYGTASFALKGQTPNDADDLATKAYVDSISSFGVSYEFRSAHSQQSSSYYQMERLNVPLSSSQVISASVTGNGQYPISFLKTSASLLSINAGSIHCHIHAYKSVGGSVGLTPELYIKSANGTETEIITTAVTESLTTSETEYDLELPLSSSYAIGLTDGVLIKFKTSNVASNPTVYFVVEGQTSAGIDVPIPSEQFVFRTGDTMTGPLIAPSVTASLQGTASVAITASYANSAPNPISTGSTYPITASFATTSSHSLNSDTASKVYNQFDNFQTIETKNYVEGNMLVDIGPDYSDVFSVKFAQSQSAYVNLTLCNAVSGSGAANFYGEYFLTKDGDVRFSQPGYILEQSNNGPIYISSQLFDPGVSSSAFALTVQMKSDGPVLSSSLLTYVVRGKFVSAPTASTQDLPDAGNIVVASGSGDSFEAYRVQSPITDTLNSNTGFSGSWAIPQAYQSSMASEDFEAYPTGSSPVYHSFTNWNSQYIQLVGSGSGLVVNDTFPGNGAYAYFPYDNIQNRSTMWTKPSKINLVSGSYLMDFVWGCTSTSVNQAAFEVRLFLSNEPQEVYVGQFYALTNVTSSVTGSIVASSSNYIFNTGTVANPAITFGVTGSCSATLVISRFNNTPEALGWLIQARVRNSASLSNVFTDNFDSETLEPLGSADLGSLTSGSGWSGSWRIS